VARRGRGLRTFRLSAIQYAEASKTSFVRPRRFDLAAHWARATRRFEEGVYHGFATLRASPIGLAAVRRFSAVVAQAADRTAESADAGGWRKVTIPIESTPHATRELLKIGAECEVIEPPELRDAMRREAGRLLALYAR
jgi:predicted DNA-binding transcriptional regulator YafY